jgi:hypothetical protein
MSVGVMLACGASCTVEPEIQVRETRSPLRSVGQGIVPHLHPELWPHQVSSPRIVVHYRTPDEQAMAEEVLGHVENAWTVQFDQGGAVPPLPDNGVAGPDGRFDVYVLRGVVEPYVVGVAPDTTTWYDDWSTSMVVDPWGVYGGAELEPNIFHELRHASQATHDWWEHEHVFEAEATLWEIVHYGFERVQVVWQDYQSKPEWTLFRADGYRTWYMYGGALFLLYLRDHVFGGDLSFSNQMWQRSRNAPGANQHPALNEPDFADALQDLLAAKGRTLFGEVLGFARARWYTGARANGSLPGGAVLPDVAHQRHIRNAGAGRTTFTVSPQLLGTGYVAVERAASDPTSLWVSLSGNTAATKFAVQALGGAAGDVTLDLAAGPAKVTFEAGRTVTFVVTALPTSGAFDPDQDGGSSLKAWLTLSPTP